MNKRQFKKKMKRNLSTRLIEAWREMELHRQGKIKLKSWSEFIEELREQK